MARKTWSVAGSPDGSGEVRDWSAATETKTSVAPARRSERDMVLPPWSHVLAILGRGLRYASPLLLRRPKCDRQRGALLAVLDPYISLGALYTALLSAPGVHGVVDFPDGVRVLTAVS